MRFVALRFVYALDDGRYLLALPRSVRAEITRHLEDLRQMLLSDTDDPRLVRLFPGAYTDDPESEAEYQRLMRGDLIESRLAAFDTVERTMAEDVVTEADLHQWLQALNAIRLMLAMIIGIDDDEYRVSRLDPRYATYRVYVLLTELLHDVSSALRAGGALDQR
ncbi:MAG: DUF2017 family protein [Actinobacteria bacterium]|nr:DUF2017 family protein [Actinomycetota bacterium]